ncbi:MAG: hypothetical protein GXX96_32335 [Planctomycetaceae bacterium]|nr:hypothetical protein [Planctomycetaceae bacterium]
MTYNYPAPCCCCDKTCAVFSDDFDEEASTTLNANWSEESGDWVYTGTDCLRENGTPGACLLATAVCDNRENAASCIIRGVAVGDKIRLIVNAVDANNYFFAEVEQKLNCTGIRLYRRKNGSNTLLQEYEVEPPMDSTEQIVGVCITDETFSLNLPPSPFSVATFAFDCNPELFMTGKRGGLGNGGTSALEFSNFSFGNAYPETTHCCAFQCMCEGLCIPRRLLATMSAGGGCASLDGTTFYLDYLAGADTWVSDRNANTPACLTNGMWEFSCFPDGNCITGESKTFGLVIRNRADGSCYNPDGGECGFSVAGSVWEACYSCNPFVVAFPVVSYPPFEPPLVEEDDECDCCDFYAGGWWQVTVTVPSP